MISSGIFEKMPSRMQLLVFLLVLGFLFGGNGLTHAEPRGPGVVHIVSDRLEAHQQDRQVVFSGHVVATQGELTIKGDRLTIFYLENNTGEASDDALAQRVDRIVVEGNVRISQKNTVATGKKAVYYSSDNKVVLTGEPRVRRDTDIIQGTSITLYLDSEKSVVEGGPSGPVEATIFSSGVGGSFNWDGVKKEGSFGTDRDEGG
ncbi:MAG: lipopolysaccharide transport periplasmic protein LptA [Deltaproteobacteria bacterium]|nr:MAG: lipopolysaccharide transport periplasmic protein LptA [Deltaproteobacteria bacterium]